MISNIACKYTAYMQLSMHEQLQAFSQTYPRAAVPVAAFVSVADVAVETAKYPVSAIESVALAVINAVGLPCFKECNLSDTYQNIKIAGIMSGATAIMSIASPFNLLGRLLVNLPDPKNAHSCNKEADEQANFPAIAYDSNERRDLLTAIREKEEAAVIGNLLTNDKLTNQSIGRAIENAAENGHDRAVSTLLADSRLTKHSIGRAIEKATENNHSEILPLLIGGLTRQALAKNDRDEAFISQCLSRAKKIAMRHGYPDIVEHLNKTAKSMKITI